MKKKLIAVCTLAFVACLSVFVLAGCQGSNQSSESSDKGAEATTLIVGFDASYPPYGFVGNDGNYTGFDLDLAAEVCKRNNWTLQLEPIDWDAKDALLNSGAINCIWNGFTFEGRENDYSWTEPYMLNEQVLVVKSGAGVSSEAGLAGKTVVTQADSAALDVLEGDKKDLADTFASLTPISDYNQAFLQLESGAVDAVACDLSIAAYQLAAKPGAYTQLAPLSSEHYAVGFKKGDDAMAQTVTDTLKAMYADGTVKTLCDLYVDYGMSYENWVLK